MTDDPLELDAFVDGFDAAAERLRRVLQVDTATLIGEEVDRALRDMRDALTGAVRENARLADLLLDTLRELEDTPPATAGP